MRFGFSGVPGIGFNYGGELDTGVCGLKLAIDAEVVAAEGSGADNCDSQWSAGGDLLCPFAFDGAEAAAVEREQLGHVLLGLGAGGGGEAGGGRSGAAGVGDSGDEPEQIESDVFIAAGAEAQRVLRIHMKRVSEGRC